MMKRAHSGQEKIVVEILSQAFDQNPSVNFVVRQDAHRAHRVKKLMEYSFRMCHRFGEVWITEDRKGCALLLFPDIKRTSWQTIWWDIVLAYSAIGLARVKAVMNREIQIKEFHPVTPFAYLWFIGVVPESQSEGIGSVLLQEVIRNCQRWNRPVYLETSVNSNLLWYQKFGFEVFHSIDLGYTLHLLRRYQS